MFHVNCRTNYRAFSLKSMGGAGAKMWNQLNSEIRFYSSKNPFRLKEKANL